MRYLIGCVFLGLAVSYCENYRAAMLFTFGWYLIQWSNVSELREAIRKGHP